MPVNFIEPDWPAPKNVRALQTTRLGGVSVFPFESLNLGAHVEDSEVSVRENRKRLQKLLPSAPLWLQQVHGTSLVTEQMGQRCPEADGSITQKTNEVCTVMTADCLPVLLCDEAGTQVAAVHAGWRGLADGILEEAVGQFKCSPDSILAWLGPAIGPNAFEVGKSVYDAFCSQNLLASGCFVKQVNQPNQEYVGVLEKWHADIYALAKLRLNSIGLSQVYGGDFCTYTDEERFFSYRRDGKTGRMASCIWLSD